ncbi:MAG: hypothetical protein WD942_08510, partial [Dehalococcoidia bacterium]
PLGAAGHARGGERGATWRTLWGSLVYDMLPPIRTLTERRKLTWQQRAAREILRPLGANSMRPTASARTRTRNAALIGGIGLVAATGAWFAMTSAKHPTGGVATHAVASDLEGRSGNDALATERGPAVDAARLRYAQGELSREQFVQIMEDLGASPG